MLCRNSTRLILQLNHYAKEFKGFVMFPQERREKMLIMKLKKIAELERKSHKLYYLTPNRSIGVYQMSCQHMQLHQNQMQPVVKT